MSWYNIRYVRIWAWGSERMKSIQWLMRKSPSRRNKAAAIQANRARIKCAAMFDISRNSVGSVYVWQKRIATQTINPAGAIGNSRLRSIIDDTILLEITWKGDRVAFIIALGGKSPNGRRIKWVTHQNAISCVCSTRIWLMRLCEIPTDVLHSRYSGLHRFGGGRIFWVMDMKHIRSCGSRIQRIDFRLRSDRKEFRNGVYSHRDLINLKTIVACQKNVFFSVRSPDWLIPNYVRKLRRSDRGGIIPQLMNPIFVKIITRNKRIDMPR